MAARGGKKVWVEYESYGAIPWAVIDGEITGFLQESVSKYKGDSKVCSWSVPSNHKQTPYLD